jgi:predicted AAA+ superfamily ATPase
MIIIHDMNEALPRALSGALERAAAAMPVVVITGARQTGKSTLVRKLTPVRDRLYLTLDDLDVLGQAQSAPRDLVARAARMTLDEVQRAPDVLLAVKQAVDERRQKGRFFLTGSANLLLMRNVSESLAGRAVYLTLWPMTRREQLGAGRAGIWSELLAADDDRWFDVIAASDAPPEDWRSLAARGGFPTPALELHSIEERDIWFAGYVKTFLERDLQDLSSISALPDFRRLMRAASLRIGQLVNQTELGRDVALPQPTVHRYLNLLETSYHLVRVPAYAVNRTKRLIKTPKIYWGDAGLAQHLTGDHRAHGGLLENIILMDLMAWREGEIDRPEVLYWRTASGEEVDFVVETQRSVVPIEVKTTTRPRVADTKGLRSFRDEYADRTRPGLLLHCGEQVERLGPGIIAAPWWRIL